MTDERLDRLDHNVRDIGRAVLFVGVLVIVLLAAVLLR
jgi:hypothetical protein